MSRQHRPLQTILDLGIARRFIQTCMLGLVLLLPVAPAIAAPLTVRYVSVSGTDWANASCAVATPCRTIAYAINVAVAGDTINIGSGTFIEFPLNVAKNLTFVGKGVRNTIIDVNAQGSGFTIQSGITAEIRKMTIRDGKAVSPDQGGGIRNLGTLKLNNVTVTKNQAHTGGGIFNQGSLTLLKVTLASNTAAGYGGGLYNASGGSAGLDRVNVLYNQANLGGGIYSTAAIWIYNTAIAANPQGGGIASNAALFMENVTVSGNAYPGHVGGGISITGGDADLYYVTISANSSTSHGAIYVNTGGSASLFNSIVYGNGANPQCGASGIGYYSDGGHNVLADQSCSFWSGSGSVIANPKLKPLTYNGGFSQTHALKPASPAIDLVPPKKCITQDQRDVARPVEGDGVGKAKCDSGAFEYQP